MALKRPVYHLTVVKSFPYISGRSAITSDTADVLHDERVQQPPLDPLPPRGAVAFLILGYDFLPLAAIPSPQSAPPYCVSPLRRSASRTTRRHVRDRDNLSGGPGTIFDSGEI